MNGRQKIQPQSIRRGGDECPFPECTREGEETEMLWDVSFLVLGNGLSGLRVGRLRAEQRPGAVSMVSAWKQWVGFAGEKQSGPA